MRQNIPLGILLLGLFTLTAPFSDALSKMATKDVMLWVIILWRFGGQVLILAGVLAIRGNWETPKSGEIGLLILRGGLHVVSMSLMVAALRLMPLADAISIAFVLPFLMLASSHFILGEKIHGYQIWCSLFGFLGVGLVLQPNFMSIGWAALLPLGTAVSFAGFQTLTRMLSTSHTPYSMQFYSGLSSLFFFIPFILLTSVDPIAEFSVSFNVYHLLLGMTVSATLGHLLLSASLTYAPQSMLAPLQYVELPFVILYGYLFFGDIPVQTAFIGIIIIFGSGLYASGVGPLILQRYEASLDKGQEFSRQNSQ